MKKAQMQGANKRLRRRSKTYVAQRSDVCNAADDFLQQLVKRQESHLRYHTKLAKKGKVGISPLDIRAPIPSQAQDENRLIGAVKLTEQRPWSLRPKGQRIRGETPI